MLSEIYQSKSNLKIIRLDRQNIPQRQYPVNPVKIPCFLKWVRHYVDFA